MAPSATTATATDVQQKKLSAVSPLQPSDSAVSLKDTEKQHTPALPNASAQQQQQQLAAVASTTSSWLGIVNSLFSPWQSISGLAESACLNVLRRVKKGCIRVVIAQTNGRPQRLYEFGDLSKPEDLTATVTVKSDAFWTRLMLYSALGFGESFMYNEIDVDNLTLLLLIFIKNREYMAEMNLLPKSVTRAINAALHSQIPNTIYNAVFNIQAHYDLGNEMFAAFLDPTMMYSCPIWDLENPEQDTLEKAQYRKIHAILDRAGILPGDRVLEVGTGWGALAIECCKRYPDTTVTTLTLSKEQKALAEARIQAAGFSDRITVLLQDYRSLDPSDGHQYDRIVTVEMLEAVGPEFLPVFFKQADALLHPTRGTVSLQVITMPDARYPAYLTRVDFIQKHIFPGGHCPSVSALVEAVNKGSQGKLIVDELVNIGPHYAKALRLWKEKFVASFDDIVAQTGRSDIYTEEFRRKWEFYFSYCEAGFATRTLGDVQVRLTREANVELMARVPL